MEVRPRERHRQCIGCRALKDKADLIRIIRTPDGQVEADPSGKKNGRGAYLCKGSPACLETALKKRALERALKCPIPEDLAESLRRESENGS